MESKKIQEPKKNDDVEKQLEGNDSGNVNTRSRFSRRRFIRSTAVASPILLSVKSPVAWGGGLPNEQYSIAMYLSGNASHPQSTQISARAPAYWLNTFQGGNEIVLNELNNNGCYASTQLYTLVPLNFNTWLSNRVVSNNWQYKLDAISDNPTLLQSVQTDLSGSFSLWVDFKKNKSNTARVDILNNVSACHCCVVTGYLNGIFHPMPVNYIGDSNYVRNLFIDAINQSINLILSDLDKNRFEGPNSPKYSQPIRELSNTLNTWDS